MTSGLIFLVQALAVVALPVAVLRFSGLKGLLPLVVVQIATGIALGPSLLGRVAPEFYSVFVNPTSLASLSGLGSVAVLVFGLITGLHLDPSIFRDHSRTTSLVAAASVVVPATLGFLAGYWIIARHPEELSAGITSAQLAAAIGICTGVTALPVLGAILCEMNLLGHRIGQLALGAAGFNDMALWILLGALLTATAGRAPGGPGAAVSLLGVPVYLLAMLVVVRPLLGKLINARMQNGKVQERALAVVGAVTIASAIATEIIGLHYILGAFVIGVVMPEHLRKPILDRLQGMTLALLMPFFFVLTGMRTLIDAGSLTFLEIFIVTTIVAVIGKVGGSAIAARCAGESWPISWTLGALLQTKGLMEVIVLTILLDAKIISATMFSALVLMALVSTALAMPLARIMLMQETKRELPPQTAALAGQQIEQPWQR
jgi:Kef-type K+ transport system membrane component KefB